MNAEINGRAVVLQSVYKDVAKQVVSEPLGTIVVTLEDGSTLQYFSRMRSGTICIQEEENDYTGGTKEMSNCTEKYLTCVDPSKNSYKFYQLQTIGDQVKATYGRMGVNKGEIFGARSFVYPISMFWIKYEEKLAKGYVDQTDLFVNAVDTDTTIETGFDSSVAGQLYKQLYTYAKRAVETAKVSVKITPAIIEKSEELIEQMRKSVHLEYFNQHLLGLIAILQRPVATGDGTGVRNLMAKSEQDMVRVIERETDLLSAMKGIVVSEDFLKESSGTNSIKILKFKDTSVFEATEKQKTQVLDMLGDDLKKKVKRVYRVIPEQQQKKFDTYLKEHKIKKVKQLWHGSRNENWLSIIESSLQLNPNAIITGKMFGHGIYFAPSAAKSFNYTSYRGTSWARGNSDTAFMGVYAVAYGTPYETDDWMRDTTYNDKFLKDKQCDCLHAKKGQVLRNDEIIFYHEDAMVLNYIVEFN